MFPGVLPARVGDGSLLPESLLSYTYDITFELPEAVDFPELIPATDQPNEGHVVINGEGWGHGVGMSQWGAKILADGWSTYSEILSHYSSGVEPEQAPEFVPESVVVGLDAGLEAVRFDIEGLSNVLIDGGYRGIAIGGTWSASVVGDEIVLVSENPFSPVLPVSVHSRVR